MEIYRSKVLVYYFNCCFYFELEYYKTLIIIPNKPNKNVTKNEYNKRNDKVIKMIYYKIFV